MTLNHINVNKNIYWEKRFLNTHLLYSNHRLRSFNKSRSDHLRSEFTKIQTVNNGNQCANYYHELKKKGNTRSSTQKNYFCILILMIGVMKWNDYVSYLQFLYFSFRQVSSQFIEHFFALSWYESECQSWQWHNDLHDRHPYSVQSTFVKSRLSNKK